MAQPPRQNLGSKLLRNLTHGPRLPEPGGLAHLFPITGPLWKVAADFQRAPPIPRPNTVASFFPVAGPLWEATGDFQDANYGGAALNAGFAAADAFPVGSAVKGGRFAAKLTSKAHNLGEAAHALQGDLKTAKNVQQTLHRYKIAGPDEEVHHSLPLNGVPRNVPHLKNSYPFLKVLPKATHRRLTGNWGELKKFGPVERAWHGSADWMKTGPVGLLGNVGKVTEHVVHPSHKQKSSR
jgi:hypothetical protein